MKNYLKTRKFFILVSFCSSFCFYAFAQEVTSSVSAKEFGAVEHKNLQLDLYLDLIRYNTQEKIGILPYILQKPEGVYLEIGTGGDPIAEMLAQIPLTSKVTLIASDIEEGVLQALPSRHPKLQNYLDAKEGLKLRLMQLNATDMTVFEDDFLNGINASSVVHEIISYGGGFDGMDKFFKEASRTLKPGGVLVYRDPESVSDCNSRVSLVLKNKNVRLFGHLFLYKFLDKRGSSLESDGRKFCMYQSEDILFTVFKKNASVASLLSYEEYLKIPSYDIDFSRKYTITLPCGLYRELARHYLTYLHQCNPLMYIKCIPNIVSGKYIVNYLAHSTGELFSSFLTQSNQALEDGEINFAQKIKLDQHTENLAQVIEFGIPLHFSLKREQCELRNLLQKHGFEPHNYIISINNEDCLLDYRIFGLLYDDLNKSIFNEFNGFIDSKDKQHAQWLRREGEESYFYLSADELITTVLKTTQREQVDELGNKKIFVLCPLTANHNKFIERICYSEILRNSFEVQDDLGYEIDVIDGKRVVHFSKMLLEDALDICRNIVEKDPMIYKKLKLYIDLFEVDR